MSSFALFSNDTVFIFIVQYLWNSSYPHSSLFQFFGCSIWKWCFFVDNFIWFGFLDFNFSVIWFFLFRTVFPKSLIYRFQFNKFRNPKKNTQSNISKRKFFKMKIIWITLINENDNLGAWIACSFLSTQCLHMLKKQLRMNMKLEKTRFLPIIILKYTPYVYFLKILLRHILTIAL